MGPSWFDAAMWDDADGYSHNTRCNLRIFTKAAREFRDSLNHGEFTITSNNDIINLVRSSRYSKRLWWRYVDAAASRSEGATDSTAVVLWQCSTHVMTCRIVKEAWVLLPGYVVDDIVDILELANSVSITTFGSNLVTVIDIPDDDELEEMIEANQELDQTLELLTNADSLFDEFDTESRSHFEDEDNEYSLLKIDRDLEKDEKKSNKMSNSDVVRDELEDSTLNREFENDRLLLRIQTLSTELSRTQRLLQVEIRVNSNLREALEIHREDNQ